MYFIQSDSVGRLRRRRGRDRIGKSKMKSHDVEIVVVGAGIVGIAAAYFLATRQKRSKLLILDAGQPMTLTSAQSGENYRNWWPHPAMTALTDHSIGLMEDIARQT